MSQVRISLELRVLSLVRVLVKFIVSEISRGEKVVFILMVKLLINLEQLLTFLFASINH